ncbi:hypothetical protein [Aquipuribacter sp. SD81]|uniref:hypothetical protein n=1 Tax=Aquipuribacter sp. SD81 TaxID=3127703 RepID=UPI003017432B
MSTRTAGRPGSGRPPGTRSPARGTAPGRGGGDATSSPVRAGAASPRPARARLVVPLTAALVGLLVGVGLGGAAPLPGGSGASPEGAPSAAADDPLAERVAELRAEAEERDAEAYDRLVADVQGLLPELTPVVEAAAVHAEPGAPVPSAEDAAAWHAVATEAASVLEDPPSAGTDVNVARAAFAASLVQLEAATTAFQQAAAGATGAGDAEAAMRPAVLSLQGAAATWSVGATQLDAVSVARDRGHVHLYLPPVSGSGALTADPEAAP